MQTVSDTKNEVVSKLANEKMPRCPICSGHYMKSYKIHMVGQAKRILECRCGLLSKPFNDLESLLHWWKTRGGNEPAKEKKPEITVKHAPPGDTVSKGKGLVSIADAVAAGRNPF